MYNQDMHIAKQTICGNKLEEKNNDENPNILHTLRSNMVTCVMSHQKAHCA